MENQKHLNDLAAAGQFPDELAKLFDYPSVGELFSRHDSRRFDEFRARLTATRENLERIIRYGTREEAERAARAVKAVDTTLEFLESLQKMRQNAQK
ncbi:MAG TPA: hypothetical protein VIL74_13935 [Pyrinomonadaceae bacterium]|jgi:hypothetical protein